MKKLNTTVVAIIAIIAITALISMAILKGINGAALSSGIAIIAGLGGYTLGKSIKPQ